MRKIEKPPGYYDQHFEKELGYHVHYKDSFYYVHWTQVIVFLKKIQNPKILEIGCGTGQLAEYLKDEGFVDYNGFDFSPKAIALAKGRVNFNFFQGNALAKNSYNTEFNTIICLEVLEHIQRDIDVLQNIPANTGIIFSVPNFDAPSHVRWFTSERQIKARYFRYVDIKAIIRVGNIYLCRGVISPFKPGILQKLLASREEITVASFHRRILHRIKNGLKLKLFK